MRSSHPRSATRARAGHGSARRHGAYHRQPARETASLHVSHPFGDSRPRSRSLTLSLHHRARTAGPRVTRHRLRFRIPSTVTSTAISPSSSLVTVDATDGGDKYRPLRRLNHSIHPSSRLVVTVLDDLSLQDRAVQRNVGLVTQPVPEDGIFHGGPLPRSIRRPGLMHPPAGRNIPPSFRCSGPRSASASSRRSGVSGSRDCEIPGPRGRSAQQEPACLPVSVRSPAPPLRQLLYQHQAASALLAGSRVLPDGR